METAVSSGIPTMPPPVVQGGLIGVPTACFKLKSAFEYRFWRQGRPIDLKKGDVFKTNNKTDIDYFRSKPDVIGECDAAGHFLADPRNGAMNSKKAKSFRTYGQPQRPTPGNMPPVPGTVHVGASQPAPAPVAPSLVKQVVQPPPMMEPVAKIPESSIPQPPSIPTPKAARSRRAQEFLDKQQAEMLAQPITPIEEVGADGAVVQKTQVRRS